MNYLSIFSQFIDLSFEKVILATPRHFIGKKCQPHVLSFPVLSCPVLSCPVLYTTTVLTQLFRTPIIQLEGEEAVCFSL